MGGQSSKVSHASGLGSQELRRVSMLIESTGHPTNFTLRELKSLWFDILVPEMLDMYVHFIKTAYHLEDGSKIHLEDFISLYVRLVRGTMEEKALTMGSVICGKVSNELESLSLKSVEKYVCALLGSYVKLLIKNKDKHLESWMSAETKMDDKTLLTISEGLCSDLEAKNDKVSMPDLESWLSHSGLITNVQNHIVEAMYNMCPEDKKLQLLPYGKFPTANTHTILDVYQIMYLNSFLPSENKTKWRFLFSTQTHGESFSSMLSSVINQGPTILVIEDSDNYLFGGFASVDWNLGPKFIGNDKSFLFTLSPSADIFTPTGYNHNYMYINTNQVSLPNGLGMGGQFGYWGLYVDSKFGEGECSESCTTFRNYKMLAAKSRFHIRHLEVWSVGNPPPTDAEKGERSVLDKDPVATRLLEMAGKKQYSHGLRDEK